MIKTILIAGRKRDLQALQAELGDRYHSSAIRPFGMGSVNFGNPAAPQYLTVELQAGTEVAFEASLHSRFMVIN